MAEMVHEKHLLQSKFREKFAFLYDTHSLFYYVLLLIGVGLGFFGFALITQRFTTPYSGDYSQQYFAFEYDFYDDWWTFFKTGQFPFYDSNTFLGADNIISNTYYGLFSPFTFPILFFPRSFVPHAMALMSIAKLVTGALLFRLYLKYMGASESSSRIFSIAYAFMGWTAFYLWFNNFYDVLTFFPLILFGIEKIIKQKQIWACSLGFFLMGLGNYFFLLTFGIFGVIYAGFRFFQTIQERGGWKNYKDHLAVLGLGVAGFALGYLMGAIVLFPAIVGSFGISRSETTELYLEALKTAFKEKDIEQVCNIVFKWWHPDVASGAKQENYYFSFAFPIASYFYPTLSDRYVNIVGYSSFENAGSSIFFFTPCIIMFGGCVYRSIIHKKISHFIAIALCVFCLFVPFFYFLSGAFANNYGRWEIVVPAMGLVYIALNFDHRDEIPRWAILLSGVVALAGMIATYLTALRLIDYYGKSETRTHNYLYPLSGEGSDDQIAVVFYEITLCVLETFILAGFWKKKYLNTITNLFIIGEAIVMGTIVANMHYLQDIETDVNTGLEPLSHQVAMIDELRKEDGSFYRMYSSVADESHVNMPEAANYNGLTTFHTFYNNEVDDFVHMTNVMCWEKSWAAHYIFKHQYLESFLGVKYYMTRDTDTKYYGPDHVYDPNVPLNYSLYKYDEENGYRIYKNDHHIDFGIAYDTLYYKKRSETDPVKNQFYTGPSLIGALRAEEVLFKGAILNDEDVNFIKSRYKDTFAYIEKAPSLSMKHTDIQREGIYLPYVEKENKGKKYKDYSLYIDPENPTKYLTDKFLVDDFEDGIEKKYYQIVYTPEDGAATFPHDEEGTYFVLNYPIRTSQTNYNTCVWLIDEEGKTITFDEMRNTETDIGSVGRGLYSKKPVAKIILCPLGDDASVNNFSSIRMYYAPYKEVLAKIDNAANNGIKNLKRNVNNFTFNTEYETDKFFVTQLAYTDGWRVKATRKGGETAYIKTYNAQGGFLGFVAPSGEMTYQISYVTPDFAKWALVSAAAFLGAGALTIAPIVIKKRKEKGAEAPESN